MSVRKTSRTSGKGGIHNEPAYVLHRYEWSEASLILELFTRNLGRVAVAAKGVRRPASSFRSVLLPFQPLLVSLGGDAEIRQLKGVEWAGGYTMPTGAPLLVGYYANELLMRLLGRDDVQPLVFDAYAQALAVIASQSDEQLTQPMLRAFELILLQALGVLPALDSEALTFHALEDGGVYLLEPEIGLVRQKSLVAKQGNLRQPSLPAFQWLSISKALQADDVLEQLPFVVAPVANELKYALRVLFSHYSGTELFHTRKLMQILQKQK